MRWFSLCLLTMILTGCFSDTTPPQNFHNSCLIFEEKPRWRQSSIEAVERWGGDVATILAIMYQESSFIHDNKPRFDDFLGLITLPWRKSSAYGYAQAKDETWDWYIDKTGNHGADRDNFADAVDFIAWYNSVSRRMLSIRDDYGLYLAYHEGHGGYKNKTYQEKSWLMSVARKVAIRASKYRKQWSLCQ